MEQQAEGPCREHEYGNNQGSPEKVWQPCDFFQKHAQSHGE